MRLTRTKTSVLVAISALFIFVGRFLYVPFINDWDVQFENGIFGFNWLSIFLSRFGNEIAWFAIGFLLIYLSSYLPKDHKRHIKNLAALILLTAGYFTSWIFYQDSNFSQTTEMGFSFATSLMAYFVCKKLYNATSNYIDELKEKIRNLMDFLILKAPNHVKDVKVWDAEIVEPALEMLDE